jgi:thiol-disulfide isomerase/thioredoxin
MWIRSLLITLLFTSFALADQTIELTPVTSGITEKTGGSLYQSLKLSETKPDSIKKVPSDLSDHVLYGILKMQNPAGSEIAVILDSPDGKPSRLFVDSNGNGDLTDDKPADWVAGKDYTGQLPGLKPENLANIGSATVKLGTKEKPFDARIGFWRYDVSKLKGQTPAQQEALGHELRFYRDYGLTGKITIEGKEHQLYLLDELATGSFKPADDKSLVRLFIDLNDNGKIDEGEMFDVARPMKINDHIYEVKQQSADGRSLTFGDSDKTAYSPDDVKVGKIAPEFNAELLDGKPLKFPGDYQGKIVMIDFWATWCAPCMAEVPNVAAAYEKYHASGFEVLGITMDEPTDGEKVKRVMAKKKMVWPELFGETGKTKSIAEMFSVNAIPAAFLIDGDTGKILAAGEELRGDGLEKALAKFVPAKSSGTK